MSVRVGGGEAERVVVCCERADELQFYKPNVGTCRVQFHDASTAARGRNPSYGSSRRLSSKYCKSPSSYLFFVLPPGLTISCGWSLLVCLVSSPDRLTSFCWNVLTNCSASS